MLTITKKEQKTYVMSNPEIEIKNANMQSFCVIMGILLICIILIKDFKYIYVYSASIFLAILYYISLKILFTKKLFIFSDTKIEIQKIRGDKIIKKRLISYKDILKTNLRKNVGKGGTIYFWEIYTPHKKYSCFATYDEDEMLELLNIFKNYKENKL